MKEYGEVLENISLKKYNSYKVGGNTRYLINPYPDKIKELIKYLKQEKIPYYIIGGGTNIIFPDNDFSGAIIKLTNLNKFEIKENECLAESGCNLSLIAQKCLENGFTNLAFAIGIPGTIGGAIRGNAGAYGHEIFDYLKDVTILDEQGNYQTLSKAEIKHDYRYTEFKKRDIIILKATFKLEKKDIEETKKNVKTNLEKRRKTQPLEYNNAGSVFKNPPSFSAGKLIEDLGLKGKTIGGAQISEKHANFIINIADAKSSDIISLIDYIKKVVKKEYNIDLEEEQIIINW